jgi:hypothetical protein
VRGAPVAACRWAFARILFGPTQCIDPVSLRKTATPVRQLSRVCARADVQLALRRATGTRQLALACCGSSSAPCALRMETMMVGFLKQ